MVDTYMTPTTNMGQPWVWIMNGSYVVSRIRVPHGDRRTGSARLYLLTRSVGGVFVDELPVVRYKGPTGHAYRLHYTSAAGDVV